MPQMSPAQSAAFEEGTGGIFTAAELSTAMSVLICATVFAWSMWIVISVYRQWTAGEVKAPEAFTRVIRAMVVMTLVFLIVLI